MTEKEISSFISKVIHDIYYGELKKEQYVYLPFKTGNLIRNGLNRKFDAKQGHWEIYLDDTKVYQVGESSLTTLRPYVMFYRKQI